MSKFAGLKSTRAPAATPVAMAGSGQVDTGQASSPSRLSRQGKRMVGGHFSPELSRALNILAAELGVSVQALLGEAIDLVMRQHGKHPFGER